MLDSSVERLWNVLLAVRTRWIAAAPPHGAKAENGCKLLCST